MILRIILSLSVVLAAIGTSAQEDSIVVQFPDGLTISNHSNYDADENIIYSVKKIRSDSGNLVLWDVWNGIPVLELSIPDFDLGYDEGVDLINYKDSLVFFTPAYENTFYNYHYDKELRTVTYKGKFERNTSDRIVRRNFSNPNNSKDESKGYQKVTGINISEDLTWFDGKQELTLTIKNANYYNRKKLGSSDEWERFETATFVEIRSNDYYFENRELAILDFNTIAGSISESYDKLALLESDYRTLHLFRLDEHFNVSPWKTIQVNLPDTLQFAMSFTSTEESIVISNLFGLEYIDLNSEKSQMINYDFCDIEKNKIITSDDTLTLDYYNDIRINNLNNRISEVVFYNESGGWTYEKYKAYCSESTPTVSIIFDTKEIDIIHFAVSKSVRSTSLEELLLLTSCEKDQFSLFDINRKQNIKEVKLNHQLEGFNISLSENSNSLFAINKHQSGWGSYDDNLYEWFPMMKETDKTIPYLTSILIEESTVSNNKAIYSIAEYADPGLMQNYFELLLPNDTVINDSYWDGELSYRQYNNNMRQKIQRTNSFTSGTDDAYYYIYQPMSINEEDSLLAQYQTDAIVQIKKITDTIAYPARTYPGYSTGVFFKQKDKVIIAGKNKGQIVNYLTSEVLSTFELTGEPLDLHISSNEKSINYVTKAGLVQTYDIDKQINTLLGKIDSMDHYLYNYYWSPNKDYLMIRNPKETQVISFEEKNISLRYPSAVKYVRYNSWSSDSSLQYIYIDGTISLSNNGLPLFITDENLGPYAGSTHKKIFKTLHDQKDIFYMMIAGGDWLLSLPNGMYYGNPKVVEGISFRKGFNAYPYEQFDHFYNRPDKVMEAVSYFFGEDNQAAIDQLNKAYLKRLRKLGIRAMNELPQEIPQLEITNKNLIPHTAQSVTLDMAASAQKTKIVEINIEVNGVPVLKKDISPTLNVKFKEDIQLMSGFNLVKVYCRDAKGNTSLASHLSVYGEEAKELPSLYIVTIGTSKYEVEDYNLTYAAKDAIDFATQMEKSEAYQEVHTKTFTDETVSKVNLTKVKEFLVDAKINDEVMIFVAGHGVLDEELDYYIATHDMNFEDPKQKGLKYEQLEHLLQGIKPLKKVILLDACHSGEIDKEEVALITAQNTEKSEIQFRAVGNSVSAKQGVQNTSELTKSLFADLRRGTGATVISAAGGMEFAMESNQLKNGLFTYCFLNGIQTMEADTNKDGEIWLKEIQQYVQEQVSLKSGGKQQPTSRIENSVLDYRIW